MKKSKTKSILACAVLASVLGTGLWLPNSAEAAKSDYYWSLMGGWVTTTTNISASSANATLNSTVSGDTYYTGYSSTGEVKSNTLAISNGGYNGCVIYGGYSQSGSATSNTVIITGGNFGEKSATVIYGGYSKSGSATFNTVTISGGTFNGKTEIYGGNSGSSSSNTLNLSTTINVSKAENFQNLTFTLSSGSSKTTPMLTASTAVSIAGVTVNVYLGGYKGEDTITLISSVTGDLGINKVYTGSSGSTEDKNYKIVKDGNALKLQLATVTWYKVGSTEKKFLDDADVQKITTTIATGDVTIVRGAKENAKSSIALNQYGDINVGSNKLTIALTTDPKEMTADGNVSAGSMEITAGNTLKVNSGKNLTVTNGVTNKGTLTIGASDLKSVVNNGTSGTTGTVNLKAGTLASGKKISGGTLNITGDVKAESAADIAGNTNTVTSGKTLTLNAGALIKNITNSGTVTMQTGSSFGTGGKITSGTATLGSGVNFTKDNLANIATFNADGAFYNFSANVGENPSVDQISVTGKATGTITLGNVTLTGKDNNWKIGDTKQVCYLTGGSGHTITISETIVGTSEGYKYTFGQGYNTAGVNTSGVKNGYMDIFKDNGDTLEKTITGATVDIYALLEDYTQQDKDLGELGGDAGTSLTIEGNGHKFMGDNHKGITIGEGKNLTMDGMAEISGWTPYAFDNDGTLNIKGQTGEGNKTTLDSGVTGTGTTNISGNVEVGSNGSITQNGLTIAEDGSLTTEVDALHVGTNDAGPVTNNGTLILTADGNELDTLEEAVSGETGKGTLTFGGEKKITAKGIITQATVNVNTKVDMQNTLTAAVTVGSSGTLTIAANNLVGTVTNGNVVNLSAGTLANGSTITGGTLNITGDVIANAGDIAGGTNAIAKDMKLTLNGGDLGGNLSGDGSVVINGDVTSAKTIANAVTIESEKKLTNTGTISGAVTNEGTFDVTAGSVTGNITNGSTLNVSGGSVNTVTNTGTMNVTAVSALTDDITNASGTVNFDEANVTLTEGVTVNDGTINVKKNLTATVTDLASTSGIFNKATLTLTGEGDIQDNINNLDSTTGTTVIDGTISNAKTIANAVTIKSGKKLTNTGTISGAVTNAGTFDVTGGSVTGNITNSSTLNVSGGAIDTVTNTGTMNVTAVSALTDDITNTSGTVNLNADGTLATGSTITGGTINVNADVIVNAADIAGDTNAIAGSKKLIFNGGTLGGNLSGDGSVIVDGDVSNDKTVGNAVTINSGKKLTNTGTLSKAVTVDGTLDNTGTLSDVVTVNAGGLAQTSAEKLVKDAVNKGTVELSGGTLAVNITDATGTTKLTGDVALKNGMKIEGTLDGNNQKITIVSDTEKSIDTFTVGTLSGNLSVVLDVDMSNFTSDKLEVTALNGSVTVESINIVKDITPEMLELPKEEDNKIVYLTNDSGTGTTTVKNSAITLTNNYKYTVSAGTETGKLKYKVEAVDLTFKKFMEGTLPDYTSDPATLSLTADMANTGTDSNVVTVGTNQSNDAINVNLNGHNLTSANESTITINSGKTVNLNGGSEAAGTVDSKTKFSVAGTLAVGGNISLAGDIANTGTVSFAGTTTATGTLSGAGSYTNTGALTIADASKLTMTGTDGLANTGTLNLGNTTSETELEAKITGNGITNIVGKVKSGKDIGNAVVVAATDGEFSVIGGSVTGAVTNNKTMNVSDGSVEGGITNAATGTVNVSGGEVKNGAVINAGTFNVTNGTVSSAVTNSKTMTLNGTGTVSGAVTITDTEGAVYTIIAGTQSGTVVNNKTFSVNGGTVSGAVTNAGTFNVTAGSVTGNITNGSTLNVSGGTVKIVTNTGTMNVTKVSALTDDITNSSGTVNFDEADATLTDGVTITGGTINVKQNLTATVTDLASTSGINNKAILTLTGTGDIKGDINNLDSITGTTVIDGTISNAKTIANAITIESEKKLTNTGTISGAVTNNGTFEISGGTVSGAVANNKVVNFSSGTLNDVITGASGSSLNVIGDVTTQASKIQGTTTLTISDDKILTLNGGTETAYDTLISTVTLGTTGTLKNTGYLDVQTDLNCAVDNDGTLEVAADKVKASIDNSGTVNLGAGELGTNAVLKNGTVNLEGVVVAKAGNFGTGDDKVDTLNFDTDSYLNIGNYIAGGTYDSIAVGTLKGTGSLEFDIDLSKLSTDTEKTTLTTGDKFTVDSVANGTTLTLKNIHVTAALEGTDGDDSDWKAGTSKTYTLFSGADSNLTVNIDETGSTILTNKGYRYTFAQNDTNKGDLDVTRNHSAKGLKGVVQGEKDIDNYNLSNIATYSLVTDYDENNTLGVLAGDNRNLTIDGNNYKFNVAVANENQGIAVGAGQTLNLQEMAEISGWKDYVVNNGTGGTVNIKAIDDNQATTDTVESTVLNSVMKGEGSYNLLSGILTVADASNLAMTTLNNAATLNLGGATSSALGANIANTGDGTGTTNIVGIVTSDKNIANAVNVNSGKQLTNTGIISGAVTNEGTFTTTANGITGGVKNTATMELTNGDLGCDITDETTPTGTTTVSGTVTNTNNKSITQKVLTIAENGSLTTAVDKLVIGTDGAGSITVTGTLNLVGGEGNGKTLAQDLTGTGTVQVSGGDATTPLTVTTSKFINMNGAVGAVDVQPYNTLVIENTKLVANNLTGGGWICVDPSYMQLNGVNGAKTTIIGSKLDIITDGSVVNVGNTKDNVSTAYSFEELKNAVTYEDLNMGITENDFEEANGRLFMKNTDKKLGLLALKGHVDLGEAGGLAITNDKDTTSTAQINLQGDNALLVVDRSIAFNDADCVDDVAIFKTNNANFIPNVAIVGVNGKVDVNKTKAKLFLTGIERDVDGDGEGDAGVGIYAIMQGTGIDGSQYFDIDNDMVMQDGGDTYRIVELDEQEQKDLNAYLTGDAAGQKIYAVRVDWNKVEKIFTGGPINGQEAWNNMLQNDDKHTPGKEWLLKVIKGTKQDREVGRSALNQVASLAQDLGVERAAYDVTNMVGSAIDKHWKKGEKQVWASYIRNKDEIDSLKTNGMDAQYTAQYNGAVVGVDITKGFGLALAYADGDIHNTFDGRNEADYYGGSMYFHRQVGNFAVGFDATYLYGKNELTQNVFGTEMSGKARTDTISGGMTAKYLAKAGKFGDIGLFTGARYMHINSRKFSDNLGISHEAEKINSVVVPVGLEYNGEFKMKGSDWTWKPRLAVGYLFNLGDRDNYMVMNYRGVADSFLYDFVDKGAFFANAGMAFEKKNFSLGISYDFMKSKNSKNRRWNVNADVAF